MKIASSLKNYTLTFIILITIIFIPVKASAETVYPANAFLQDSIAPDTTGMGNLSAVDFAKKFYRGWNLGNSLEAIGGETAWGNPLVTQQLIDSVKAAGFNTIRIPVAWSRFTDTSTYSIDTNWLARVEQVVNYALNDSMYVIINEHWDRGWMQPTYSQQSYVNNRFSIMWEQIAIRFRDYDNHLLFAGTNEVMKEGDYGTPTVEYYTVQNGFNQLFVNTIRSTGGRNTYRYLVVQGFNTNIDYTVSYFDVPQDVVDNRLMVEVHYYDPYNFTINSGSSLYVWGDDAPNSESWANEAHADEQFQKMKTNFVDLGYLVIIGEYCAMARLNLGEVNNSIHAQYRLYYMQYITRSMLRHGLVPYYWDSGHTTSDASGLFYRSTGVQAYPEIIQAIMDTSNVQAPVPPVGMSSASEEDLLLYPVPSDQIINVELPTDTNITLNIYDSYSRHTLTLDATNGLNSYNINRLAPGIYFLEIATKDLRISKKFIKN